MVGIDLDMEMVKGTQKNLKWLMKSHSKVPEQIILHGDATNITEILNKNNLIISGLVFDPPYGKNAWKSEKANTLFSNVLKDIRNAKGISSGSKLVCFLPIKPKIHGKDEPISGEKLLGDFSTNDLKFKFKKLGWSILSLHAIPIHGSLARMLIFAEGN